MKHEKWITFLIGTILSFMLSFSCAGCITSAFDLGRYADLTQIAIWCALISMICNFLPTLRVGWVTPCLLAVLAIVTWKYGDMERSLKALLHSISVYCDEGYDCGTLEWNGFNPKRVDRTLAIQAICSMVAMFSGWCISEKRGSGWAIMGAIVALTPCTLVIFSVPDEKYLILWLGTIVILLLTQGVRRQNEREGNRLTLWLLAPIVFASIILFHFLPQDEYTGRERAERLLSMIEPYLGIEESFKGDSRIISVVDLQNEGASSNSNSKVMEVSATKSGTYYLRGRVYNTYTGTSWRDSGDDITLPWQPCGKLFSEVKIQTTNVESVLYVPYYSDMMESQDLYSHLKNTDHTKHYSFNCYEGGRFSSPQSYSYDDFTALTQLPDETYVWASAYLREQFGNREYFAELIAEHVRSHARYDLSTPKMSDEYSDFAQWFLMESDIGYCVHFATSTAVLLRAAGIPARYVTGYYVEIDAGQRTEVYQKDAHAWVEYWTPQNGWQILESTPSNDGMIVPESSEVNTEVITEEESTEEVEETPGEIEETVEDETTEISSETEVTEPTKPTETTSQTQEPEEETAKPSDAVETVSDGEVISDDYDLLLRITLWIGAVILIVILIIVQWRIRLHRLNRKLQSGSSNERILQYWALILRYTRTLEVAPERSLYQLVSKAKFSQHTMTEEEVYYIARYTKRYIQELQKRPWYKKLYDRLVLAMY